MDAPRRHLPKLAVAALVAAAGLVAACVTADPKAGERHRWWAKLGPVLPHDTFPADCKLCHVGDGWSVLTEKFYFDHAKETGVPLRGAHADASCLRCHNDRGPAGVFAAQGCGGCHADVHQGDLGSRCTTCHQEETWHVTDAVALHERTRFPLTGAHTAVACQKCHTGGLVGNFAPADTECATCHVRDLLHATNPPHVALGLTQRCDRCHMPTTWHQAELK